MKTLTDQIPLYDVGGRQIGTAVVAGDRVTATVDDASAAAALRATDRGRSRMFSIGWRSASSLPPATGPRETETMTASERLVIESVATRPAWPERSEVLVIAPIAARHGLLRPGLYELAWRDGGRSLAAVGMLHDGRRWFAPCNWTASGDTLAVVSCDWSMVESATEVRPSGPGSAAAGYGDLSALLSDIAKDDERWPGPPWEPQIGRASGRFDGVWLARTVRSPNAKLDKARRAVEFFTATSGEEFDLEAWLSGDADVAGLPGQRSTSSPDPASTANRWVRVANLAAGSGPIPWSAPGVAELAPIAATPPVDPPAAAPPAQELGCDLTAAYRVPADIEAALRALVARVERAGGYADKADQDAMRMARAALAPDPRIGKRCRWHGAIARVVGVDPHGYLLVRDEKWPPEAVDARALTSEVSWVEGQTKPLPDGASCSSCGARLMFSARLRGDGLCGPCSRSAPMTEDDIQLYAASDDNSVTSRLARELRDLRATRSGLSFVHAPDDVLHAIAIAREVSTMRRTTDRGVALSGATFDALAAAAETSVNGLLWRRVAASAGIELDAARMECDKAEVARVAMQDERNAARELIGKLDAGVARISEALGFAPGGANFTSMVEAIQRIRAADLTATQPALDAARAAGVRDVVAAAARAELHPHDQDWDATCQRIAESSEEQLAGQAVALSPAELRGLQLMRLHLDEDEGGHDWSQGTAMADVKAASELLDRLLSAPGPVASPADDPGPCTPMAHHWASGEAVCRCGEARRDGDCRSWKVASRLTDAQIRDALTSPPPAIDASRVRMVVERVAKDILGSRGLHDEAWGDEDFAAAIANVSAEQLAGNTADPPSLIGAARQLHELRAELERIIGGHGAQPDEVAELRAALAAACDLGEPVRGADDPRLKGPHRAELMPVVTTGLTREQLHDRWADLRMMAGGHPAAARTIGGGR